MRRFQFLTGNKQRRWVALILRIIILVLLLLGALLPQSPAVVPPWLASSAVAHAQGNTIRGLAFLDYNSDGVWAATGAARVAAAEPPVAGVTVKVYDTAGQVAGNATTGQDGQYSINVNGVGPYRVEFSNLPPGLLEGISSVSSQSDAVDPAWGPTTSGSSVQFVLGNSAAYVNLPLVSPADYCPAAPALVANVHIMSKQVLGTAADTYPALVDFPYAASGATPADHALQVSSAAIGATWGLGYDRTTRQLYASAYMKRFTEFGPNGTGAIYQIAPKPDPGQARLYADLNAIFGANTAGPDLHSFSPFRDYKSDAASGLNTIDAVGKTALGGLDISDDDKRLYVMNLYDRQLYEIPLDAPPTAANIRHTPVPLNQNTLPQNACPNPNVEIRPFAVEYYKDSIYVGMVCSGETSPASPEFATWSDANKDGIWNQSESYNDLNGNGKLDYYVTDHLQAYVYKVDPATLTFGATPVLAFPLNYSAKSAHAGVSATWNIWRPTFLAYEGSRLAYPEPMLSGLAFDHDNMIVALRDRFGDKVAYSNVVLNPALDQNSTYSGGAAGDILRACGSPTTGWTLENNASCGGVATGGAGSGQGPGGGEYYFEDFFLGHSETSLGAVVNVPGFPEVVSMSWDPIAVHTQGVRWLDNQQGIQESAYAILSNAKIGSVRWGKGGGLGDVVALCDTAPLELGNRVWLDSNGNGIQDPNERGIDGVTVRLYRPGVGPDGIAGNGDDQKSLALAVTDVLGEYYFINGAERDAIIDEIGVVTNTIAANATYEIRLDKAGDYQPDEPLYGLSLTELHDATPSPSGSERNDSDAVNIVNPVGSAAGTFPVIVYTTGGPGSTNYGLDFGFDSAGVSIGNQVWFDTNNNGQVDPQETGIANVNVDLFRDADGNGTLAATEQTPIAARTTTGDGFYLFTQDSKGNALPPGNYCVGVPPANFASGGPLVGAQSSGVTMNNNGVSGEATAPAPNTDQDNDDNGSQQTSGFYTGGVLSCALTLSDAEPENEVPANQPATVAGTTPGLSDTARNNASNLTVDFGFYQTLLGDRVFVDSGNNGLRDGTDLALNNVTVRLFAADGTTELPVGPDGILHTSDDGPGGMVTANRGNGDGQYFFAGLPQGDYIVRVTPPSGYTSSTGNATSQSTGPYEPAPDPDGVSGAKLIDNDDNGALAGAAIQSLPVTLTPGDTRLPFASDVNYVTGNTTNRTVDFGLIEVVDPNKYSVGNRVWLDTGAGAHQNNGLFDAEEHGVPNLLINLYATTPALTLLKSTRSDVNGYYRFDNLDPGDYVVEVIKPTGYSVSSNGLESDPNLDGDSNHNGAVINATSVRSNPVTLGPGNSEPQSESDLSSAGQGALDSHANMTVDFGFVLDNPLSLGNQVFADRNNDGRLASNNELGISGVQVNLYADLNNDGIVDDVEAAQPFRTTTTALGNNFAGYYLFSGLAPGQYVVELPPSNFAPGGPLQDYVSCSGKNASATGPYEPAGDPDDPAFAADLSDSATRYVNPSSGAVSIRTQEITLDPNSEPLAATAQDGDGTPNNGILDPKEDPAFDNDPNSVDGNENLTVDFCLFKPYSLGNRVWLDANDNGNRDTDEPGLSNVVVGLYDLTNTLLATTTSDLQGYYAFDYLIAGDYLVDVTIPTSSANNKSMRSSTPNPTNPTQDNDDNGVDLRVAAHVRSNPVTIGDAQASDTEPVGESDLSPVVVGRAADARADLTVDFGFFDPVDLGSRIFNDAENKGYRVSGQLNGFEGTIVYLYEDRNADGTPDSTAIMSQTTNFAGDYLFTDLRPGTYMVEIVPPPGFVSSTGRQGWTTGPYEGPDSPDPNAGPGGGLNNDDNGDTRADGRIFSKPMTLTSRQENALDSSLDPNTNRTLDFAVFKPLSLGNLVWDDLNDNGLLDTGETGIDGVVINLYHDANFDGMVDGAELATPVTTTVTANGGEYLFRHLGRGNYVVALASSNFAAGGVLASYRSSDAVDGGVIGDYEPAPDPNASNGPHNNPIDNDDNGQVSAVQSGGREIVSKAVTLAADKAPTDEQPNNDPITPDKNANLTVDFGVYLPFSLGNRVWFDVNNNGQQDTGEPGIGDVLLNLYLSDGSTKIAYTYTDANGYYRFDNLRAGQYIVEIASNNFITGTEAARGVLLNGKSSSSDEGAIDQNMDQHDNGAGNLVDINVGVRSAAVQLGLGGVEPRNEADLASGANPQGTQDSFANLTVDFGFYNIQPTALEETAEPHASGGRVFIPLVRR